MTAVKPCPWGCNMEVREDEKAWHVGCNLDTWECGMCPMDNIECVPQGWDLDWWNSMNEPKTKVSSVDIANMALGELDD